MYAYAFENFNNTSWNNDRVLQEFIDLTKEVETKTQPNQNPGSVDLLEVESQLNQLKWFKFK